MNGSKIFAYVFVIGAAALLLFAVYKTFINPAKQNNLPIQSGMTDQMENSAVPPTLTPQEREIVASIETLKVEISATTVSPSVLAVKKYDQVAFYNMSGKTIKIDGGTWGKVPLNAGENMTQAFKEIGTFDYTVPELNLSGQVVVK